MVKETYEQFKKRMSKEAQSQQNKVYKKLAKNAYDKTKKISNKLDKNISKTGKKAFKGVSKAYGTKQRLSSSLLNIGAGFAGGTPKTQGTQQRVKEGPGRPRGDYKHRDPQTGQPIPATLYYKRVKQLKREAQQKAQQVDQQAIQQLSKRGIPPEQAKQVIDTRQLQSVGVQPQYPNQMSEFQRQQMILQQIQQQQMPRPMPQQIPQRYPSQAVRPIWRNREGRVDTDWGLFGRKQVVRGVPQSFWN